MKMAKPTKSSLTTLPCFLHMSTNPNLCQRLYDANQQFDEKGILFIYIQLNMNP